MATIKQKRAAELLVENGGNVSQAMLGAKYSPATAKTPQKLTESKGFQEILEKAGLTDNKLAEVIKEGVYAKKIITSPTEPDKEYPDHNARHKFIETTLRLKGYSKDPVPSVVVVPIYAGRSAE